MDKTFNVILTTIGRNNLSNMLDSLSQLKSCDYLTIVSDANHQNSARILSERIEKLSCEVNYIKNPTQLGFWGHASRNKFQNNLKGGFILNADDDNIYLDGAFDFIRENLNENKVYLYKHTNQHNVTIWNTEEIYTGNIDTSCGVIPNTNDLPDWEYFYEGDAEFYKKLVLKKNHEFINHQISRFNER
jgi:hypothetical protein